MVRNIFEEVKNSKIIENVGTLAAVERERERERERISLFNVEFIQLQEYISK